MTPYQFTPEGGSAGPSSKDYSGKGLANYSNGEVYEGDYKDGVGYVLFRNDKARGSTRTRTGMCMMGIFRTTSSRESAGLSIQMEVSTMVQYL